MIYALDTNIISYLLRGDIRVRERYMAESRAGHECVIPPVAYYEIKRGLLAVNATAKLRYFAILCQEFEVGEMNVRVWDAAARFYAAQRRKGRPIEDADLFIAAFCVVSGYTLATNNTKHFEGINGRRLSDWTE